MPWLNGYDLCLIEQKRNTLFNNAARLLRLDEETEVSRVQPNIVTIRLAKCGRR